MGDKINTFLPYQDFAKSAASLDDKRLNNQINEALIILRTLTGWYSKNGGKGWPNHPNVKIWQGYELALAGYTYECLVEWVRRSDKNHRSERLKQGEKRLDNISDAIGELVGIRWQIGAYKTPEWLTEDFCQGHRKLLLEKDFAFYSGKFDPLEIGEYNVLA